MIHMDALKSLDLSSNRFTEFPIVIFSLASLERISAADNQIQTIEVHNFELMSSLSEINLINNPLDSSVAEALRTLRVCKAKIE